MLRDGILKTILIQNLVPGDVCEITEGLIIYCDMRILDAQDVQVQMN